MCDILTSIVNNNDVPRHLTHQMNTIDTFNIFACLTLTYITFDLIFYLAADIYY